MFMKWLRPLYFWTLPKLFLLTSIDLGRVFQCTQCRFLPSEVPQSCPHHGPLDRYVKLRVVHAPGMPGKLSPPPWVSHPDLQNGTCVTHVLGCMPGSLTSGFLWSRWRGKRSRHSRRMRNKHFYVSGKRPTAETAIVYIYVKMSLKQRGHFPTNGFAFPLIRQMLQNTEKSTLNLWVVVNRKKCKRFLNSKPIMRRNCIHTSFYHVKLLRFQTLHQFIPN